MGPLRAERPAGPLATMALVEATAAVVCEPGIHTTDPLILTATLQASPGIISLYHILYILSLLWCVRVVFTQ